MFGKTTTIKQSVALAAAALASTAGLAACGSSGHPAASPQGGSGGSDTIVIRNFAFQPSTLVVAPGAKVTVRNTDSATHTVTASGGAKAFDTGNVAAGAVVTFTAPMTAGSYGYICQIHQFMHGTLQVR